MILDAQLLVLLCVGLASKELLSKHKRLKAYTEADFDLLARIVGAAREVIVTPNTLTEALNIARQMPEPAKTRVTNVLGDLIGKFEETYVSSKIAVTHKSFSRLGLSDVVLLLASADDGKLLTADVDLYLAALAEGRNAINFHHLREAEGIV